MTDCIQTTYALNRAGGYGAIYHEGKHMNHSRVAYLLHHKVTNESITGKLVMHSCDNPACVNPDHLVLGTHKDNMRDKVAKGRWTGGQPKKLTDEQVLAIRAVGGGSIELAKKYRVSVGTINNVLNFKSCYTRVS